MTRHYNKDHAPKRLELTPRVRRVIAALQVPLTRRELGEAIADNHNGGLSYTLRRLREYGLLEILPPPPGRPREAQRLRVTVSLSALPETGLFQAPRDYLERRAAKRGKRRCLGCQQLFGSEGPHNRLCPQCRGRSDGLSRQFQEGGLVA